MSVPSHTLSQAKPFQVNSSAAPFQCVSSPHQLFQQQSSLTLHVATRCLLDLGPAHTQHWHGHRHTCGLVNLLKGLVDHLLDRLEGILGGGTLLSESRQCLEDLQTSGRVLGSACGKQGGVEGCPLPQPSAWADQGLGEACDVL